MNKKLVSLGISAFLLTSLSSLPVNQANALPYCTGSACNDKDPIDTRCINDAYTVEKVDYWINRWQDWFRTRRVTVKLMYSPSCRANWVSAYVPDGTWLFIRERTNMVIRTSWTARGKGYFWAWGNMANGNVVNQACIVVPGVPGLNPGTPYFGACTGFH